MSVSDGLAHLVGPHDRLIVVQLLLSAARAHQRGARLPLLPLHPNLLVHAGLPLHLPATCALAVVGRGRVRHVLACDSRSPALPFIDDEVSSS
jgi:hypothetical protein